MYRNKKLLSLAKGAPCQYCGRQDGSTVAAHSNQQRDGKGVGFKAADYRISFLCFHCHNLCDGREGKLTKEEKREMWEEAHRKTIGYMFENGLIKV
jgi:hypothetical protein